MEQIELYHGDCIRISTNFGETVVYNLCQGTQSTVPWGSIDYLAFSGITVFALAFVLAFAAVVFSITRDIF